MKAIISTTYDDKYLFFLPIVTYCWNKLGVEVICFMPAEKSPLNSPKSGLMDNALSSFNAKLSIYKFFCPENKEATYSQCSRLYAGCLDLPNDEILITSDVDMAVFYGLKKYIDTSTDEWGSTINILGVDLVPKGQFPICYAWGSVKEWRKSYQYSYGKGYGDNDFKTYQEYLDLLLGDIDCENIRGNYWSKDQQELFGIFSKTAKIEHLRARANTQFASHRVDRDDINWRSYVDGNLIDAHLWRNGYEESNFNNILELLSMKYPEDNFDWLIDYRNEYLKLL